MEDEGRGSRRAKGSRPSPVVITSRAVVRSYIGALNAWQQSCVESRSDKADGKRKSGLCEKGLCQRVLSTCSSSLQRKKNLSAVSCRIPWCRVAVSSRRRLWATALELLGFLSIHFTTVVRRRSC